MRLLCIALVAVGLSVQSMAGATQTNNLDTGAKLGFGTATIDTISADVLSDIREVTLPEPVSGTGPFTYSFDPALPMGLSFDQDSRELSGAVSGTASDDSGITKYTYTATNAAGDSGSLDFMINVRDSIPQRQGSRSPITGIVGGFVSAHIHSFVGGNGDLSYSFAKVPSGEPLFDGLMYDFVSITGQPREAGTREFTFSATDADGDTAEIPVTITISPSPTPAWPNFFRTIDFPVLTDISVEFPQAFGGTPPYTYSLADGEMLPDGLTLDAATGRVTGRIAGTAENDFMSGLRYTFIVTDANGNSPLRNFADGRTEPFPFTVRARILDSLPSFGSTTIPRVRVSQNISFRSEPLPIVYNGSGGAEHARYSIKEPLPDGVMFDEATRELHGTPTAPGDYSRTYIVTDLDGDTDDLGFTISVERDSVPRASRDSLTLDIRVGTPIGVAYIDFTGGNTPLTYSIKPGSIPLPTGVVLEPHRLRFSGTFEGTTSDDNGTIVTKLIATDRDGDTTDPVTLTLNITDDLPDFGTKTIADITVTQNSPLPNKTLPQVVTAGTGDTAYSLSPTLPTGLTFDKDSQLLSGTPEVELSETLFTYTATDEDLDTTSLTFNITVIEDTQPAAANPTQPQPFTFVAGVEKSVTLIAFTGGNGELTHLHPTPALPMGLKFDAKILVISGKVIDTAGDDATPSDEPLQFTYTATDEDGDAARQTFTIAITDSSPDFGTDTTGPFIAVVKKSFASEALPAATSDAGNLKYSITPSLPSMLRLNSDFVITGIPNALSNMRTYTYTATNVHGETDSINFILSVEKNRQPTAPPDPTTGTQAFTFATGVEKSVNLLAYTNGNGKLTHQDPTPTLPMGLEFDAESLTISGAVIDMPGDDIIPSDAPLRFTYTATDVDGDTAPKHTSFTIAITDALPHAPQGPTIKDYTYLANEPITAFALPASTTTTSHNPTLTYSVSTLPMGLMFSSDGMRTISGTPTKEGETVVTYSATDGADTASVMFTIEVYLPPAPQFDSGIEDFTVVVGITIGQVDLPRATNDDGDFSYSLSPDLPKGLIFTNTDTALHISGEVEGTDGDDALGSPLQFTYTATHSNLRETQLPFAITVIDLRPDFGTRTINDITVTQNSLLPNKTLPALVTPGTGEITYSLSPTLPTGLTFNKDSRLLSGTPEVELSETLFTYTATDEDLDTTSLTFNITVIEDTQPVAPTQPQPFTFVAGVEKSVTLMAFTGGNGKLTHLDPTPALPMGLKFDAKILRISGTVIDTAGDDATPSDEPLQFTYTATDEDGDAARQTFTIAITDIRPDFGDKTIADIVAIQNIAIPSVTLPEATSGMGTLTYSLDSMPLGLKFNADTRVLSGTAVAHQTITEYTYTATDEDLDRTSLTFNITVIEDTQPVAPVEPQILSIELEFNSRNSLLWLAPFTEGNGELTYSLKTPVPGLSLDPRTRALSIAVPADTPADDASSNTYMYTATDVHGDTADAPFTLAFTDARLMPPTINFPQLIVDEPVPDGGLVLPPFTTATDDNPLLTYTFGGDTLPSGLSFNFDARTFTGTPDKPQTVTLTYTAADKNGKDKVTVSFTIEVVTNPVPRFGAATIDAITAVVGIPFSSVALPLAMSGNDDLVYTITPTLPDGLSLKTENSVNKISGTPNAELQTKTYRYTATDEDGDEGSIDFSLTVDADTAPMAPVTNPATGEQDFTFVAGVEKTVTLAAFTGGNGELTHLLDPMPALPMDLEFDADDNTISGIVIDSAMDDATPIREPLQFTYTATDADGDASTAATFTIAITDIRPDFGTKTIADIDAIQNLAITSVTLPEATSGTGTLTYSLDSMPSGLMFDANTRVLSGTPDVATQESTNRAGDNSVIAPIYTYTATDADGDTDSLTFDIAVEGNVPPLPPVDLQSFPFELELNPRQGDVTLAPFTGGNGELTYTLPTPVPGLTLDPRTRKLSVEVPADRQGVNVSSATHMYRATDIQGDTADAPFTIVFTDAEIIPPTVDLPPVSAGIEVPAGLLVLPPFTTAPNDSSSLTYTYGSDKFPLGLKFERHTRSFSGIPRELGEKTFTYTASDTNGADSATANYTIVVEENSHPTFRITTIDGLSLAVGETALGDKFTLPLARGGNRGLVYTLAVESDPSSTPITTLLGGLEFDPDTRMITGTVAGDDKDNARSESYRYKAADGDDDIVRKVFTLTITDELPDFGERTIDAISINDQVLFTSVEFPSADSGTGELTYSVTPALPTGLTFDPVSQTISGTPTVVMPESPFTYKVADEDGDTATLPFTITITNPVPGFGTATIDPIAAVVGIPYTSVVLPTATGGNGELTYSIPDLPAGLSLNAGRVITGTSDDESEAETYTYTATDEDGDMGTIVFRLSVDADTAPTAPPDPTTGTQAFTFVANVEKTVTLMEFTGGNGKLTYALVPGTNLPTGLELDADNHTISGKAEDTRFDDTFPTPADAPPQFTYTATDADGDAATTVATFTIAITDVRPDFDSATIDPIAAVVSIPYTSVVLPQAINATGILKYSITPTLPVGLRLTTENSVNKITGTSDATSDTATYTYIVTDEEGDSDTIKFNLAVEKNIPPMAPTQSQPQAFTFAAGLEKTETLAAFTGGNGKLTYALASGSTLPDDLEFDAESRTISGTVLDMSGDDIIPSDEPLQFTYTATDADGDTAHQTFTIAITDALPQAPTIQKYTFPVNEPITAFALPAFTTTTAHNPTLTHSVSTLPLGLMLSTDDLRTLSGTPTVEGDTVVTYEATDGADSASVMFTIEVDHLPLPEFDESIQDFTAVVRTPITQVDLPRATNDDGNFSYSLSPSLPTGLNFDSTALHITGAVLGTDGDDALGSPLQFTYTATHSNLRETQLTFAITVIDLRPDFGTKTITDITVTQNSPLPATTLPALVTAGTGDITYSLVGTLPTGTTFNADSRLLSGTPVTHQTITEYTYTATDEDLDTTSLTFNITVKEDTKPTAPTQPQPFTFVAGVEKSVTLMAFTGGNGELTHLDPTPTLPMGLEFDADDLTISGTVIDMSGDDAISSDDPLQFTYTATDEDGDAAPTAATFTIAITDALPQAPNIQDYTFTINEPITAFALPAFTTTTAHNPTLTYSVSTLPMGLMLSTDGLRMISGTPTVERDTEVTYEATDGADTASVRFTIEVNQLPVPQFDTGIQDFTAVVRTPITQVNLPRATNDDGNFSYSLSQNLPAGLTFTNTSTARHITGTVLGTDGDDALGAPLQITYTATHSNLRQTQLTFTITVIDARPGFGTETITDITVTQNSPLLPDRVLPEVVTSGSGVTLYSLSGALPTGLTFAAGSRLLSGTPQVELAETLFTYTATDEDLDTTSLTFNITVREDTQPTAPTQPQPFTFVAGVEKSVTLMAFTGGNGELTHLDPTPTLPMGLEFDADDLTISGTVIDKAGDDTISSDDPLQFTYTATDEDGDSARQTFTIAITDDLPDFGTATIDPITAIAGISYTSEALPQAISDPGTFKYSIKETLPPSLSLNTGRQITGTPDAESETATYNYTVTDAGGDTDTIEFSLTVVENTRPRTPSVAQAYTFAAGEEKTITLLEFTGGNGELTYELASDTNLPDDLEFDAKNLEISGTVVDRAGDDSVDAVTYIYTATDEDGDTATAARFTIAITDDLPDFGTATIDPITAIAGISYTSEALPQAISDPGTFIYSITETLPPNLSLNAGREITGTPEAVSDTATYTYTVTDADGDADTIEFSLTVNPEVEVVVGVPLIPSAEAQTFIIVPGESVSETLLPFTSGNGAMTFALESGSTLPTGLELDADSGTISGTILDGPDDDSVDAVTYSYTATDEDGNIAIEGATFTITIVDERPIAPEISGYTFTVGEEIIPFQLPEFTASGSAPTYSMSPAVPGLTFNRDSGMLSGTPTEIGTTEVTYTATDADGERVEIPFIIVVNSIPSLTSATASALPSVSANIALVAAQSISSRVELALDGLSSGIEIRTPQGAQFRLNPSVNKSRQQGERANSGLRVGLWYSSASDDLTDTRSNLTWSGITESTNLGFDVGFDVSRNATMVIGIMQNSSSTSFDYRNTAETIPSDSPSTGTLSMDLDATAFYVGLGFGWLDAWIANGSADTTMQTINDGEIPTTFSYQTVGFTASYELSNAFRIGAKVEMLTSDLSLEAENASNFAGLQTDSSQQRTAVVANYQINLGQKDNGLLIPKFEFGFRDLSLGSSINRATTAAGGSAMEMGFGFDYIQKAWGLTLGLDMRSIEVENYSSNSSQWQVRWESGSYANGLSFGVKPHAVSETLGGADTLYSGGYNQYQSLLQRQRGGSSTQDSKGLDFEMGYGFVASYGTVTPYLKTTNYRGSGNQADTLGIRYKTLQGLELTVKAERELTPQTIQLLGFPLTFVQQEHSLSLNTRYSF